MPRIPTPFIGGSDSPRREQAKEDLAPPFHPEAQEAEVVSPAAEPEPEDILVVDAASMDVEEVEAETEEVVEDSAESEEAVPIEAVEAETESGHEAIMAVGGELEDLIHIDVTEEEIEETESLTNDLEEIAAEEFAISIEQVEEEEIVSAEAGDAFFPDFLDGNDGLASAGAVATPEETTDEDAPPSSRERLSAKAEELREGEFGSLIRTLVDELGPYAAEIAIARAFAAGYLAAKDRGE